MIHLVCPHLESISCAMLGILKSISMRLRLILGIDVHSAVDTARHATE